MDPFFWPELDFDLPQERIATHPKNPKEEANLLFCMQNSPPKDYKIQDLANLLPTGALLIFNNTKVRQGRILAKKSGVDSSKIYEFLVLEIQPENQVICLAKPMKSMKVGDKFQVEGANFQFQLVEKDQEKGQCLVIFPSPVQIELFLEEKAHPALPPYILKLESQRDEQKDKFDYQTVYAQYIGSAAAPTAGLHFTQNLIENLKAKGFFMLPITLHIGRGTFSPLQKKNWEEGKLFAEKFFIEEETKKGILQAKKEGRPLVAIGTTTLRALEAAFQHQNIPSGWQTTESFLLPGREFKSVDFLFTNFHLPQSSLLLLVAAFGGVKKVKEAYKHAMEKKYRFYSFGDAMLLEKAKNAKG